MKKLAKALTTGPRVALTIDRAVKMHEAGISIGTIAQQLTDNSRNGSVYTPQMVNGFIALHKDCQGYVGITKNQASALIGDQVNFGAA